MGHKKSHERKKIKIFFFRIIILKEKELGICRKKFFLQILLYFGLKGLKLVLGQFQSILR